MANSWDQPHLAFCILPTCAGRGRTWGGNHLHSFQPASTRLAVDPSTVPPPATYAFTPCPTPTQASFPPASCLGPRQIQARAPRVAATLPTGRGRAQLATRDKNAATLRNLKLTHVREMALTMARMLMRRSAVAASPQSPPSSRALTPLRATLRGSPARTPTRSHRSRTPASTAGPPLSCPQEYSPPWQPPRCAPRPQTARSRR